MRQTPETMKELLVRVKNKLHLKSLVIALSAIVVFTTTYLLILPAFTLDKQEAADQGGIDVVAVETTAEAAAEEEAAPEAKTDAAEAPADDQRAEEKAETKTDAKSDESGKTEKAEKSDKADVKLLTKKTTITAEKAKDDDFAVSAVVDKDAKVPQDVSITATELGNKTDEEKEIFAQYKKDALAALKEDSADVKAIKSIKLYDISLESDSQEDSVEPEAPVNVKIAYEDGMKVDNADNIRIVHFAAQKNGEEKAVVLDATENKVETTTNANGSKVTEASFDTEGFSKYAVVEVTLDTKVITADGKTYTIEVTYGEDAKIPAGAELKVEEVEENSAEYKKYLEEAEAAIKKENSSNLDPLAGNDEAGSEDSTDLITDARFFDISIISNGEEIEPAAAVTVNIKYEDPIKVQNSEEITAVHFAKDGTELIEVNAESDGKAVSEVTFEQSSFSVTGTVLTVNTNWSNLNNNGQYVMYFTSGGTTYAIKHDGSLTPVTLSGNNLTFPNATALTDISDYLWTYTQSGSGGSATRRISYTNGNTTRYLDPTNSNSNCVSNNATNLSRRDNGRIYYQGNNNDSTYYIGVNGTNLSRLAYNNRGNAVQIQFANAFAVDTPHTATIHIVDREGNTIPNVTFNGNTNMFTPNSDGTYTLNFNAAPRGEYNLSTLFTKNGYTYANTRLAGNTSAWNKTYDGLMMSPRLDSNGSGTITYYTDEGHNTSYGALRSKNLWDELALNDNKGSYASRGEKDIYVILDPVPSGSSGTTPPDGGSVDADDPNFTKNLVPNGDGTYTLSLSVTGHANNVSSDPKANVLLVVDTSSSMNREHTTYHGQYVTRLEATKGELKILANGLLNNNTQEKPDRVEVAMISFDGGTDTEQEWTTEKDGFTTNNTGTIDKLDYHSGTNYEAGLQAAYTMAAEKKAAEPDQPVFIVFFTDGEPSQHVNFNGAEWGQYYSYYLEREAAKDEARMINNAGFRMYGVYAFNAGSSTTSTTGFPSGTTGEKGSDLLHNLLKYGYNTTSSLEGSYYFDASDGSEALSDAFASILRSINSSVGFDDVVMNDSITSLTSTGISLMQGVTDPTGFKYTRSGGTYGTGTTWDEAPHATYSSADGVQWNLGNMVLEDGVTYTLSFTVWPSQTAYDWVADLNNGIKTWDDVVAAGLETQFVNNGGVYEVVTNPPSVDEDGKIIANQITYTKTQSEVVDSLPSGVTPGEPIVDGKTTTTYTDNGDGTYTKTVVTEKETAFTPPDQNMTLEDTVIDIQKQWTASLQSTQLISFLYDTYTGQPKDGGVVIPFEVYQGNNTSPYETINLGWNSETNRYEWADATQSIEYYGHTYEIGTLWEDEMNIATGVMLSEEHAQARGIDVSDTTKYTRVTYGSDIYYVLEGGHDYNIKEPTLSYQFDFVTETYHPMLVDGVLKSVVIEGNTIKSITPEDQELTALKGSNVLRGGINLYKQLQDQEGETITGDDRPDDKFEFNIELDNESAIFEGDNIPWYSVNGHYYHDSEGNYGDESESGMVPNTLSPSDGNKKASATVHISAKDELRIANVPIGTTYTITETDDGGYSFVSILKHVYGQPDQTVTDSQSITGDIVPNAANDITFTNKQDNRDVTVLKTAQDGSTPLPGATFDLYTKAGYEANPREAAIQTNIVSSSVEEKKGLLELGSISLGEYYLVETDAPDGYNLLAEPVSLTVEANRITVKQGTAVRVDNNPDDTTYEAFITNDEGVELPNTGGIGTTIFYILGSLLVIGCGVVLVSRRRMGKDK